MCPMCLATVTLVAASTASVGGLGLALVKRVAKGPRDGKPPRSDGTTNASHLSRPDRTEP